MVSAAAAAAAVRAHAPVLLLGVITAAVATCSGLALQLLSQRCSASAPALQSASSYLFLAAFYATLAARAHGWRSIWCSARWFVFPVLAFLDVEANTLIVWAYRYASIKAVSLISAASVPFVMLLSALLGRPPRLFQVVGAAACLTGVAAYTVWASSASPSGSAQVLGCLLALGSALAYALVNVAAERLLQSGTEELPMPTYMAALSLNALAISLVQALAFSPLELRSLERAVAACGAPIVGLLMLTFAVLIFVFYTLAAFLLRYSSAAWFNSALLSTSLFAPAGARLIFGTPLDAFYFFCLLLVATGMLVFYLPTPARAQLRALCFWNANRSAAHTPV